MTQDEVLAMLHKVVAENQQYTTWTVSTPHLVALVNQAIEKEREACADLCWKNEDDSAFVNSYNGKRIDLLCSELIRARGQA
jgi:hypothetical protein